jgi:hypothetical protein
MRTKPFLLLAGTALAAASAFAAEPAKPAAAAAQSAPAPAAAASTPAADKAAAEKSAVAKPADKAAAAKPADLPPGARVEIVPDERGRPVQKVIVPTETEKQLDAVADAATLARLAKQFEQQQDWRHQAYALERLYLMRPMQGPIGYELAAAYARSGDKRKAYDLLVRLQGSGFGFDPSNDARFEKVKGTRVWDYIVLNLQANLSPFGGGTAGFALPKADTLIESIAYDPARKQFLLASVRDGSIQLADEQGKLTPFITANAENGLLATYGLHVDAARDTLWAIGNGIPHRKGIVAADYGRSVLYKFQLSTGKFVARHEIPASHRPSLLSSMTVSPKGEVYVADGVARRIYRLEGSELRVIVENPRLTSIRGMTFNADGSKLFFADYDLGLFGIDLNTGKPFAVQPGKNFTLYGIEGLAWWNGFLVVVQNGFPPARVMRLTLDPAGTTVTHAQALDAAKPEFGTPTQGVVVGDRFWFIANSQRAQYDSYGVPKDESKLEGVRIYRSDLNFAIDSGKAIMTPAAKSLVPKQ